MKLPASISFWRWTTIIILVVFLFNAFFMVRVAPRFGGNAERSSGRDATEQSGSAAGIYPERSVGDAGAADYAQYVIPEAGVLLPVVWGDLWSKMIASGVIDQQAFESIYQNRGGLTEEEQAMLSGTFAGPMRITPQNAGVLLNLLWAFGLANKNPVLDEGPMQDPE